MLEVFGLIYVLGCLYLVYLAILETTRKHRVRRITRRLGVQ